MVEIEDNGVYEVEDIWKDLFYLYDFVIFFMGLLVLGFFQEGFRLCDRIMFENGVKEFDSQVCNVRKVGLLFIFVGYIFFVELEDRMDVMFVLYKDRKCMLDNYEKFGEMVVIIVLYCFFWDRELFWVVWVLFMYEMGVYVDKMGEFMGFVDELDGEDEVIVLVMG